MKNRIYELKDFYILWSTQGLSQLGSTMTNFALRHTGSLLYTFSIWIAEGRHIVSLASVPVKWGQRTYEYGTESGQ